MFSSLLSSSFLQSKTNSSNNDTSLIKKLKRLAYEHELILFENRKIFHHKDSIEVPLLLIDPKRGIYIIEHKTWEYSELKNASVTKALDKNSSQNALSFELKKEFIQKRIYEVTNQKVEVYNFAMLENISYKEYKQLDSSFLTFMPADKILFSSDDTLEMKQKLLESLPIQANYLELNKFIATLFTYNTILQEDQSLEITSDEQNKIILEDFENVTFISGADGSGKTTTILLKAIYEHLLDKEQQICIIKPTLLACDLLKQKLLETTEYGIVDIDFSKIAILTPSDFNDKKTDLILIDDAWMIDDDFLLSLFKLDINIVIFENSNVSQQARYFLDNSYKIENNIEFFLGNVFALTFLEIYRLMERGAAANEILILVNDEDEKNKVLEDLHNFIVDIPQSLDESKHLYDQSINHLLIGTYEQIIGIDRAYVLLFNPKEIQKNRINFIFSRAKKKTYVIYNENNSFIGNIYDKDFKNRKRVASTTLT